MLVVDSPLSSTDARAASCAGTSTPTSSRRADLSSSENPHTASPTAKARNRTAPRAGAGAPTRPPEDLRQGRDGTGVAYSPCRMAPRPGSSCRCRSGHATAAVTLVRRSSSRSAWRARAPTASCSPTTSSSASTSTSTRGARSRSRRTRPGSSRSPSSPPIAAVTEPDHAHDRDPHRAAASGGAARRRRSPRSTSSRAAGVELGVGTGWQAEEFTAQGLDPAQRGQLLTDYIGACRALWRDGPVSFESPTVSFEDLWSRAEHRCARRSRDPVLRDAHEPQRRPHRAPRRRLDPDHGRVGRRHRATASACCAAPCRTRVATPTR